MPNTSCMIDIMAPANFHNPNSFNFFCTPIDSRKRRRRLYCSSKNAITFKSRIPYHPQAVPSRTTMAKTFDAPPTLERSGSEHRVGRFPSSSLRFLSPGNGGTEGGIKSIEGRFSKRDTISPFSQYPPQTGEMPPKSFSNLRESNIIFSPHHLKDSKN